MKIIKTKYLKLSFFRFFRKNILRIGNFFQNRLSHSNAASLLHHKILSVFVHQLIFISEFTKRKNSVFLFSLFYFITFYQQNKKNCIQIYVFQCFLMWKLEWKCRFMVNVSQFTANKFDWNWFEIEFLLHENCFTVFSVFH